MYAETYVSNGIKLFIKYISENVVSGIFQTEYDTYTLTMPTKDSLILIFDNVRNTIS